MSIRAMKFWVAGVAIAMSAGYAQSQTAPPQYGSNISLETARKAVAAALAEARKQNLPMAVAVVDTAGILVAFERLDNTQNGSIAIAQDKASTAAMFRRSTKVFQDLVAGGGAGLRVLSLRGATAVEGGLPLVVDGKIVGGIGVSGGTSEQDGVVAKFGVDAVTQ
jgi:glc operon protein GlcG